MASPTSHPQSLKQSAASHSTPIPGSTPPAPPSSHSGTNRSVPSPAYTAALKATSRPLHHRNGSAQIPAGGTPRAGPSTGTPRPGTTSAADLPAATAAAAMLMDGQFSFPAGTGMEPGVFPRGVGLTPVAMQLTASQGGISAIAASQDQEEDRKRRIENIVAMMSTRWGFVSQEGVERSAKRLGLECLWEESMAEERKRTLTIAGHGVLVDVEFRGEEVRGVVLQFEGSRESVTSTAPAASEVLRQNLRGEEASKYVPLVDFVGNLERLASMDRLGGAEINCFDAVEGIHISLKRIHGWEVGKSKLETKGDADTEVLCQRSGRPKMHARGRIGLAIQYWMDMRFAVEEKTTPEAMDIDQGKGPADDDDELTMWSILIDCESGPAELFPPIRISDDWVSESVEKSGESNGSSILTESSPIDWQEPPPMLRSPKSPENGTGGLDIDTTLLPKSPDIHFVAKFEPPIIVPLQTAIQFHTSVGSPLPQESLLPTTYESLIFADIDDPNALPITPRAVETTTTSYHSATDTSIPHKHKSTLLTQPNDYARAITHLPFSHPRQIIALLPTLRQWILTASILRRSFVVEPSDEAPTPKTDSNDEVSLQTPPPPTFQTIDAELADFMSSPLPSDAVSIARSNSPKAIDITLTTAPYPQFNIHFPNGGKTATVAFSIGLNGTIDDLKVDTGTDEQEGQPFDKMKTEMESKVKRVLEVSESIGVCVEWISDLVHLWVRID